MGPLILAAALAASASAAPPALRAVGETVDCTKVDGADASQDCGVFLQTIFEALVPAAPAAGKVSFKYLPQYSGVALDCQNGGSAYESFSPAAAEDCGGKTSPFVAAGHSIWSMVGRCVDQDQSDSGVKKGDAAAFVLAHELAHLELGHSRAAREEIGGFCMKQWYPLWIQTFDAVTVLMPVMNKHTNKQGVVNRSLEMQRDAAVTAVRHCVDQWNAWGSDPGRVPVGMRLEWTRLKEESKKRELAADEHAKTVIIPTFNQRVLALEAQGKRSLVPPIAMRAGQCTMLNLKEYQDAHLYGLKLAKPQKAVSTHPESDERAARLALIEESLCGSGRAPGSICSPTLASFPKN